MLPGEFVSFARLPGCPAARLPGCHAKRCGRHTLDVNYSFRAYFLFGSLANNHFVLTISKHEIDICQFSLRDLPFYCQIFIPCLYLVSTE